MFGDRGLRVVVKYHFAFNRVRLKNMGQIKDSKKKNILGMKCRLKSLKID